MNGAAVSSSGGLGVIPTSWSIVQTGDYNADGKSDLLWRDGSGNTSIWFMNGVEVATSGALGNVSPNWTNILQRTRYASVPWYNTNGGASIWFMTGTQVLSVSHRGVVQPSWVIRGAGVG
jgi:hypothetical protein